jgi:hypothetical protein
MALSANIISLDRLQPEFIGDFFRSWQAVERFVGREMRSLHPLLNFRLMAFYALIGPNNPGRIAQWWSRRKFCRRSPKRSDEH